MEKLRVAMIGAGSRANQVIYPSLSMMSDVEICAVCDINMVRCTNTADKYNVALRYGSDGVESYQKMVREVKPDAVFCIGQPHIMYDLWQWILNEGIDLYIEKPLALTIHQARSLTYLAEKNNCVTQVSFQRRSTPMVTMLRDKCLEKGDITHAVCRFYKYDINNNLSARDHMMDDTVHSIDTLRWICGGEATDIYSDVARNRVQDINFISAVLKFDTGATAHLINSWSSGKREFSVEMHAPGIYATAEHESKGHLYVEGDVKGVEFDTAEVAGSNEFHVYTGVYEACRQFIDGCRTRKQPPSCFSDAVKTMEIAEKILAKALLENK
jgi:Predicted dehydrogenases and related proteins